MKTALITTTINVPSVLGRYKALWNSSDVMFFVAGDQNTDPLAAAYVHWIGGIYLGLGAQDSWKTSKLLPVRSITRRNIAVLEALAWGAELIISIDDDNIPLSQYYVMQFKNLFSNPYDGLQVAGKGDWFDPGIWQFPLHYGPVTQRGFPAELGSCRGLIPVGKFKIGLAQGCILGDPDTSAADRIRWRPEVHQVSEVLREGIVVHDKWVPVNTQNTAYLRKWAPAMFCAPQFGRCDDIYASLICERVMYPHGVGVHLGQPFVWQQRNEHDLQKDLEAEKWGMQHIVEAGRILKELDFDVSMPITEQVALIHGHMALHFKREGLLELAKAWQQDCEKALA